MILTAETLRNATGCSPTLAAQAAPLLSLLAPRANVTTSLRLTHFLAQAAHESALFTKLEEDLHYRPETLVRVWDLRFYLPPDTPDGVVRGHRVTGRLDAREYGMAPVKLANVVYASRNGNGDVASGDGYRYRGRGWMGLTFRGNYLGFSNDYPYLAITVPDTLLTLEGAIASALWIWSNRRCNEAADADDVEHVTRLINGGLIGLPQRIALTERARVAFGIN